MSMLSAYINYRLRAKSRHGVHSPFVYRIVEEVIESKGAENTDAIERLRKNLKKNHSALAINDLGAGSRRITGRERTVAEVAHGSATSPAHAAFLQRMIDHLNCRTVLELGSNLGLTTAYLASAKCAPLVVSIEGDASLHNLAKANLETLGCKAELIEGNFDDTLLPALENFDSVDFVYVDGNHRREATLRYFSQIESFASEQTVIAFGDIHWSREMEQAWDTILKKDSVTVSIDLFYLGLVFFRKGQVREHFILKHP